SACCCPPAWRAATTAHLSTHMAIRPIARSIMAAGGGGPPGWVMGPGGRLGEVGPGALGGGGHGFLWHAGFVGRGRGAGAWGWWGPSMTIRGPMAKGPSLDARTMLR